MTKVKRTKNIFNANIENESLFQTEGQNIFKIGQLQIKSDWLRGAPPQQYIKNTYSSLKLAQLRHELQKLKDEARTAMQREEDDLSSPTKANLFKIAVLKKKIQNFQVDDSGDMARMQKAIQEHTTFKIAQPPSTDKMLIQKITTTSLPFLFQKPITRKCFLVEKRLVIQSKKNEEKKHQWVQIDLQTFQMQVDHKKPLTTQQNLSTTKKGATGFEMFPWVQGYNVRLLLSKANERSYCLYLPEEQVERLFKFLKFHNFEKTLEKNKSSVFNQLSNQMFQKVITLFNNKLRMYDYNTKPKNLERNSSLESPRLDSPRLDSPGRNFLSAADLNDPNLSLPKKSPNGIQLKKVESDRSGDQNSLTSEAKKNQQQDQNLSQILFSPPMRRQSISQMGNFSMFKLRTKKATVFYDELEGNVDIVEREPSSNYNIMDSPGLSSIKDPVSSPEMKVFDFRLNLKQQGMSQVDQNESSRSLVQNRKRTTNISVSANIFPQISQKEKSEDDDNKNKFNINIHEIESDSEHHHDDQNQRSSGPYFPIHDEEDREGGLIHMNTGSSMSSLRLQQIDDANNLDSHRSEPKQLSPRSYQTSSSGGVPAAKVRLCLRERQTTMKGACYAVEMLYPYHKEQLRFFILQVDPEIEMQKYKVVCSQAEFVLSQKPDCNPRYSNYVQKDQPINFQLNKESNNFIFVLKQQNSQSFYYYFQINMSQIRYQRDRSQLILIKEDDLVNVSSDKSPRNYVSPHSFGKKSGSFAASSVAANQNKNTYKFAAILHLYISPEQIQLWPQLTTVEFLEKYIAMTVNDPYYDFKYNFIDKKKRQYDLRLEVNRKCVRNLLRNGSLVSSDSEAFVDAVFSGLPQDVLRIIERKLFKEENINAETIWNLMYFHRQLTSKELRLLEDSVLPSNLRKALMKPLDVVTTVLDFKSYNKSLKQRLYEVALFFYHRNPFANVVENLVTALAKQIMIKIEHVLLKTKVEEQIQAIVKIYLQVQYEVDGLFAQVRTYFP